MITIDEQAYSILSVHGAGDVTLEAVQNFAQTLETLFNRVASCGVIMVQTSIL